MSDTNTGTGCAGDPNGQYCHFTAIGVAFPGTAFSVSFAGATNGIGFDDITIGSDQAGNTPEPSTAALLLTGLGGAFAIRRRYAAKR